MNNENNNYSNDEKKALLASSNQRRRNNTFSDFPQGGLDKLPPQVIDLEEVVLGSMMLDKDAVSEVIDILTPDSFYLEKNQLIFKAIHDLFNKSEPVDILTVVAQLRKSGNLDAVGGAMYVTMLTTRVGSTSNIEFHARIINEKHIMRELIRSSSEVMKEAYEETSDVFDVLDKAEQNLFNITQSNLRRSYEDMGSLVAKALEQLQLLKGHEDGVVGVPSGLTALDRITSGWQKSDLVIVAARPAMGKCLGKGTKILMYDGSLKKVEDIKVGDYLMGDDSTPRRVLSLARGRENMYWIRQNKGIDYRVNESHILSLKRSRTDNKHQHGDILNISVAEYLTKSNKFKSNYKGYKVAVTFEHQNLPLAPYFMGLWLGDENLINTPLSSSQTNTAAQSAPNNHNNQVPQAILRQLGLLNNKHIPQQYLINSTQNRLELLAGLIDSDGHYDAQFNCYKIVQKNKLLAEQIKFLCDSLGFRTSLVPKMATINQRNHIIEIYSLYFWGNLDTIPTKIKRKQARPLKAVADWRVTGITVEFDQEDDYYGFEIDGNRLFLLEDMTVTHNTAFTLSIARNAAVEFGKAIAFFSLEMSAVQLVNRLISAETGIAADKLKKGTLEDYEWTQLSEKVERLAEAKIFIDDTPAINIFELRAKCRRLKMQHDIQLIVVDYLQLMSGATGEKTRVSGNREQEISMISRSLKSIAKELNVPVIALSQLSRAVETRGGDKRPMLSDLRESGCVTGDTLLLDAQTGQQIPIRELAQRNNPKAPFTTLALNTQYKLQQATVTNVFYSGQKQVFELTTRSGRKIKASANHPFMKLEGWTRLDTLQIGDKIAVPRYLPNIKSTNPIQNEELILLAHLIGDGCVLPKQPYHYTSSDDSNIAIVQKTAHQLFEIEGRIVDENSFKHIYLPSPYHLTHQVKHPITNWYDKLGIERVRSYEKQLPNAVFACDNNKIALFLHHLWATDGNISWKKANNKQDGTAIYYATTSLILANQVQHLLLRLQVLSTLRTVQQGKYRDIYQIHVQGAENQLLFLQKIGCYGQRGEPIPAMIQHLLQITQNPNYDTIPKDAWHLLIKPTLKNKNISGRAFASSLEMSYCGTGLYKSSISRTRLQRISNILADNTLTNLAQSEVLWDEIIAITPLGIEDVYDATVEGLHNFVANNIIVHNSIEQDADMVIFLYRPEYYGFDQDEEGNSSRGVAEVIIAKHRNGATDTAKVKFIAQNAKFTDLDNGFGGFGTDLNPIGDIITFGSRMNDFGSTPPSSGNSTPTNNNDDIPF